MDNKFTDMKLLAYPYVVTKGAKLWHACNKLGVEITNDPNSDFKYAIYWNIKSNSTPDQVISEISHRMKVINIKCGNVLKYRVDEIWNEISGYTIKINPAKFKYKYVRKSQLQYCSHTGEKHDGVICNFNQKRDPRYVYQRLIDTSLPDGRYRTLRLPIFGDSIPCVIVKDSKDRFKESHSVVDICYDIFGWFSVEERKWIKKFRKGIGLDYGELDILRDKNTEKIYVIDVNNCAGDGIFGKLPIKESADLETLFAQTFKKEFL